MDKHTKKMIAPIVIAVVIVLYLFMYMSIAFVTDLPPVFQITGILIPLLLAGVMIAMLVERIKEIRSGEEDDLSEY